ncbi:MAG: CvpA family protein [Candidatus Omnitrophota bacterium]|nr:CvpA family protein [Candidatus Omnitrophota bacterium]
MVISCDILVRLFLSGKLNRIPMELIARINWVDILVAILMLRISYVAFRDGLSHEIFPFLGSILIMVLAIRYYAVLGGSVSRSMMNMPVELANFLSFLVLVTILGLLVRLSRIVLDKILKVQWHPVIDKFGGLAVGIMKAYVVTGIVLTALSLMPLSYMQWSIRDKSLTGKYILMAGPRMYDRIGRFLPAIKSDETGKPAVHKEPAKK